MTTMRQWMLGTEWYGVIRIVVLDAVDAAVTSTWYLIRPIRNPYYQSGTITTHEYIRGTEYTVRTATY
jgi:hypothetical protein